MALNAKFFASIRDSLFDGKLSQRDVDMLNLIAGAWARYGDKFSFGEYRLAYVLATAFHETGRFRWLKEIWGPTAAQKRYEGRDDLGNTVAGDGKRFMGRGLVHITGRRNYADWSERLGLDLVGRPELAEDPEIAARILVEGCVKGTFTGKRLSDYINSDQIDYVNARRVVNGLDKAELIGGYAVKFAAALADGVSPQPAPSAPAKPLPPIPAQPLPPRGKSPAGFIAFVIIMVLAIAAAVFFVRF